MTAPKLTTTANATGTTHTIDYMQVVGPQIPLPAEGLFRVSVDGLFGFSLIPLNDLARDLMSAWLCGETKKTWEGIANYPAVIGKRLSFRIEHSPLLSSGPDTFRTAQSLSAEEHAVALAAIEAHREAKRASRVPKRRRKGGAA